ncbi:MAG: S1 RNA-binding domain-containing protein [Clostridiales bacterium]|nr:S1 RNA-binding domain-containing protein [Clostridiales bacterium]
MSDINQTMNPEHPTAEAPQEILVELVEEVQPAESAGDQIAQEPAAQTGIEEPAAPTAQAEDEDEEADSPDASEEELSFEELLEKSLLTINTGDRVKVTVVSIGATEIQVELGTKHTAYIPVGELSDDTSIKPEELIKPGDEIEAFVIRVNDVEGTVMLSKKRVDAIKGWDEIEAAVDSGAIMEGKIVEVVKGGIIAVCNGTRVFIPGSQLPGGREADHAELVGTAQQFKILEVNRRRRRVIGSIRAIAREVRRAAEERFWAEAEVDKRYRGVVKSLTNYGAFVDVGGVDGMIHLSELSWSKVRHPSEVVKVGDAIEVYIKALDPERKRISLGYKNLQPNPWDTLRETYQVGDVAHVKIMKLMPFGAFAQLIPGIDGLIYISQIATHRIEKPASALSIGDEVDVKIVSIDYDAMRVNLSIRALLEERGMAAEKAAAEQPAAEEANVEEAAVEIVPEEAAAEEIAPEEAAEAETAVEEAAAEEASAEQ